MKVRYKKEPTIISDRKYWTIYRWDKTRFPFIGCWYCVALVTDENLQETINHLLQGDTYVGVGRTTTLQKKELFLVIFLLACVWLILYASFARAEEVVQIPRQEFASFLGKYEKDQAICSLRSKQIKDLKQLTVIQAEQIKKQEEIEKSRIELAKLDDEYRRSLEAKNEELKDTISTNHYWMIGEAAAILVLLFFVVR